jgi:hypothetical protein
MLAKRYYARCAAPPMGEPPRPRTTDDTVFGAHSPDQLLLLSADDGRTENPAHLLVNRKSSRSPDLPVCERRDRHVVELYEPNSDPAEDSEPSSRSIRVLTHTDWTFEIASFQHRPLRKQIPLRPIERLPLPHDPPLKRLSLNPVDLPIYHYFKRRGQCWPREASLRVLPGQIRCDHHAGALAAGPGCTGRQTPKTPEEAHPQLCLLRSGYLRALRLRDGGGDQEGPLRRLPLHRLQRSARNRTRGKRCWKRASPPCCGGFRSARKCWRG